MADKKLDKKEVEELRRLINLLEKDISTLEFNNLVESGNAARVLLGSLRNEFRELNRDISGISEAFKKVVGEITNSNTGTKEVTKSFRKLSDIADRVLYHQKGITKLKEKDIIKLQEQVKQEKERLKIADKLLNDQKATIEGEIRKKAIKNNELFNDLNALKFKANKTKEDKERQREIGRLIRENTKEQQNFNTDLNKTLMAQAEIEGILKDEDANYNALIQSIKDINNEIEETNKLMGLGGAAVDGLGSALNKLGFSSLAQRLGLDEAKEKMEEVAESIRLADGNVDSFSNKFKVLKAGVSSIGESLTENLKDPSVIIGFVVSGMIDAFKSLDEGIGKLASNFGISYNQASGISSELNDAANASYMLNVTTQGLTDAFIELNNQFGTFAQINNEALETFTRLTKEAKLSSEASKELFASSILTGESVEDTTTQFLGQTVALAANAGIMLNQKQLLESVSKVSKATLLTLGGQSDKLAEAIVKTKLLGVEFSKIEDIANSLLNFESSIGAELEAELLTGRNLNLERARLAALNGDIATVAEEIANQIGTAADFTKMNVIQQEALAKSVGMTREDLAKSLMEREALVKLSAKEGETAQQAFNNLVKEVGLEEAKKRLGNDQLANMMASQTVQERFTAAIEKLQEVFVSLAEPLMPVLDAFASILHVIGPIAGFMGQIVKGAMELGKYLLPVYSIYKAIQAVELMRFHTALSKKDVEVFGLAKVKEELAVKEGMNLQEKIQLAYRKSILFFTNAEYRTEVLKNIQKGIGNRLTQIGNLFKKGGLLYDIGSATMSAIGSVMKVLGAFLGPFAIPIALAAGAAIAGVGYKFLKGDDVMSEGGYGKRTLLAPEGAIKLNDKDTVIAGTNLGGGTGGGTPSINLTPLVERMSAVENILTQILTKTGNVYLDNNKVGTTQIIGTYKVQ